MINYRVADMDYLIAEFKKNGVQILDSVEVYEYGKFLHIMDLEGNKIELWEPNDVAYEKMGLDMGLKTTY
jgi:predicted enzyme related to lactoylglutathione lyase